MSHTSSPISTSIDFNRFGLKHYRLFDHLAMLPFVEKVILYGSRARGDFTRSSDVDLAISCTSDEEKDWGLIETMCANADTLIPMKAVCLEAAPKALKEQIVKEGVVLYAKG